MMLSQFKRLSCARSENASTLCDRVSLKICFDQRSFVDVGGQQHLYHQLNICVRFTKFRKSKVIPLDICIFFVFYHISLIWSTMLFCCILFTYFSIFLKSHMSCPQLNSRNNGLGLLFKTILWRLFCFLSFVATGGKDGNGLKLEKFRLNWIPKIIV